ncbi:MAG: hypothetical protein M1826_002273 [Phylliscum demangeonii]|nr:MAG: hypothetical protein M1826_002273 [Phylliscum demangeonii]
MLRSMYNRTVGAVYGPEPEPAHRPENVGDVDPRPVVAVSAPGPEPARRPVDVDSGPVENKRQRLIATLYEGLHAPLEIMDGDPGTTPAGLESIFDSSPWEGGEMNRMRPGLPQYDGADDKIALEDLETPPRTPPADEPDAEGPLREELMAATDAVELPTAHTDPFKVGNRLGPGTTRFRQTLTASVEQYPPLFEQYMDDVDLGHYPLIRESISWLVGWIENLHGQVEEKTAALATQAKELEGERKMVQAVREQLAANNAYVKQNLIQKRAEGGVSEPPDPRADAGVNIPKMRARPQAQDGQLPAGMAGMLAGQRNQDREAMNQILEMPADPRSQPQILEMPADPRSQPQILEMPADPRSQPGPAPVETAEAAAAAESSDNETKDDIVAVPASNDQVPVEMAETPASPRDEDGEAGLHNTDRDPPPPPTVIETPATPTTVDDEAGMETGGTAAPPKDLEATETEIKESAGEDASNGDGNNGRGRGDVEDDRSTTVNKTSRKSNAIRARTDLSFLGLPVRGPRRGRRVASSGSGWRTADESVTEADDATLAARSRHSSDEWQTADGCLAEDDSAMAENMSRISETRVTLILIRAKLAIRDERWPEASQHTTEALLLASSLKVASTLLAKCHFWKGMAEFYVGGYWQAWEEFSNASECRDLHPEGDLLDRWINHTAKFLDV